MTDCSVNMTLANDGASEASFKSTSSEHKSSTDNTTVAWNVQTLSQLLGGLIGTLVIGLSLASFLTSMTLADIFEWIEAYFGLSFVVLFSMLVGLGIFSVYNIQKAQKAAYWFEVGQQAGNGISTLALTYTLLGISLGIGTLADQPLNAQTIQVLIGELTAQFSVAFMTTVVGLPSATLLRAVVSIKYSAFLNSSISNT